MIKISMISKIDSHLLCLWLFILQSYQTYTCGHVYWVTLYYSSTISVVNLGHQVCDFDLGKLLIQLDLLIPNYIMEKIPAKKCYAIYHTYTGF